VIDGGIFVIERCRHLPGRLYNIPRKRIFRMAPIPHHFELKGVADRRSLSASGYNDNIGAGGDFDVEN